jgi:hypothetical protein
LRLLCDAGLLDAAGLERSVDLAFAFVAKEERAEAFDRVARIVAYLEGRSRSL